MQITGLCFKITHKFHLKHVFTLNKVKYYVSQEDLVQVARQTMPFGKIQGSLFWSTCQERILLWFAKEGLAKRQI